jgi:uncharacterized protein
VRKLSLMDRVLLRIRGQLLRSDSGIRVLRRLNAVISSCAPFVPARADLRPDQLETLVPTEVRASTLPGAGKGLFVVAPVAAGTLIGEYSGDYVHTMLQRFRLKDWSYVSSTRDPVVCVDAKFRPDMMTRYINHHFDPHKRSSDVCWPEHLAGRRFIVATRDIEAGEELFYDYGDIYWKLHGA